MPKNITVLIKPASSLCNMRCRYCFYADTASRREVPQRGVMSAETAAALIDRTLAYARGGSVTYFFQGGEPLLAGLAFFRLFTEAVAAQNAMQSRPARIRYSLQTNGTLITTEFARFFAEKSFLVGVSLDGPANVHDAFRVTDGGTGSYRQVCAGIALLKKNGVECNVLSVVTGQCASRAKELYRFFMMRGFKYMQFIYCLEPAGCPAFSSGTVLSDDAYFRFNRDLFDLYFADLKAGKEISVRFFDNLLALAAGQPCEQCGMTGSCSGNLVIEADGSVYPCDFYCDDKWYLGNIADMSLDEIAASAVLREFITLSHNVADECRSCPVAWLCRGGCRRERDVTGDGTPGSHPYCGGRRKFFTYVLERLRAEQHRRTGSSGFIT